MVDSKEMVRIAAIGTWQDVLDAQRKVKKFAKDGLYLVINQLPYEEVKENLLNPAFKPWFTSQFTPRLVNTRRRTFDIDYFSIVVMGPKVFTPKAPQFFIVQVNEEGIFTPSCPLTRERAERTFKSARGVLSYLCEVKGTYDTREKHK